MYLKKSEIEEEGITKVKCDMCFYPQTVIAHALIAEQFFKYFNEVISMDNYSVITRECRDLDIKCIVPDVSDSLYFSMQLNELNH